MIEDPNDLANYDNIEVNEVFHTEVEK